MPSLTVTWPADVDPNVTSYNVQWTDDGIPLAVVSVPAVAGQTSYSSAFPNALNPGDVDGVTVTSVDSFGQQSPPIASVPPTVTIPTPPPPPPPTGPTNVALTYAP
jgi:hypothetical protein